jgi:hypothetical protein
VSKKKRLPEGGLEGWSGPHRRRDDRVGPAIAGGGEAKILGSSGWEVADLGGAVGSGSGIDGGGPGRARGGRKGQ